MSGRGPRVVIVGGGFGGLYAARALAGAPVELLLVDRRNFHLFQPLLYQVATGALSPADISAPLRAVLRRQPNARVLQAEVTEVDLEGRRICCADVWLPYDVLVLATGAAHDYFGHDEWAARAPGLKSVEDATAIRSRILGAFEAAERAAGAAAENAEPAAPPAFLVVGAGPTGVELAGAIAELARHTLRGEFRAFDPTTARIVLVEGMERVLPGWPEALSRAAARSLERLGVDIRVSTLVTALDDRGASVEIREGDRSREERIEAGTILWAAGVRTSALGRAVAERAGAPLDRAGRVRVEPDLTLPGRPEVFVIGDLAHVEQDGELLPGVAPVAMQQGKHVARAIRARIAGRGVAPFRYRDRGALAVIGRGAAVADLGRVRLTGATAWLLWVFIHILYLVGFANRVLVMVQWAYSYVTRGRAARLITG